MGSFQAKPKDNSWEARGPIVDDMKKKYGSDAVKFLRYWHEQFGFPANGSFSESKIEILEEALKQQIRWAIIKKKMKRETLLEDMQRVLKMWKAEAERRRRKREKRKKKSKVKTHSAVTAPQRSPPSSGPPSGHGHCSEPTPAPQVQAPPTAPLNITVVNKSYYERSPTLLPPLPEELSPRLSVAGGEAAAAQTLENGAEEKPASVGSTDIRFNDRLQPVVSSWHSPQTIPSWNIKALPAAPTVQPVDNVWTIEDMKVSMKHLPPVTPYGEKFAKEFLIFCRVFMPTIPQVKCLLGMHLTPEQYLKIKAKTNGNGRPMDSEWNHKANVAYRAAITDLCNTIEKAFPKKVDISRVCNTHQREGEAPDDFLIRLEAIFDEYSGMSKPDDYPGQRASPYEMFLTQTFLAALLPRIRKDVETTCILLKSARLREVVTFASHAYCCQQEAIQREQELQREVVVWNRRGRGCRGGWSNGRRWRDGCFICGAYDHWRRDCPENTGYRSHQQRRAIGNYCVCLVSHPWCVDGC